MKQAVRAVLDAHGTAAAPETVQARKLQQSGRRRVWSTLLDYRDWTSFLYVPLLVPILVVLPYYAAKWYHQSQVAQRLIEGMAQSNVDYAVMNKLLQEGPTPPFEGMPVEEVPTLPPPADAGIEVITDTRILDYRPLNVGSGGALRRIAPGCISTGDFACRNRSRPPTGTRSKFGCRPPGSTSAC